MSDLEEKGYLFHPHTSAGRVTTDVAYRLYVDSLLHSVTVPTVEADRITEHLSGASSAIEAILRRAAQSLSIVTQELGVALGPRLDDVRLRKLELIRVSGERLLLVLTLEHGAVRTIFVEVEGQIAESAMAEVMRVLNERLAGLTLRDIRRSLWDRIRDTATSTEASELLNVFVQEGDTLFDLSGSSIDDTVVLGQASHLAEQPEFASGVRLRQLLELTETREELAATLRKRSMAPGITITIGNENGDPRLENFTIVTAEYRVGSLTGMLGVIGPTRMPYEKVIALVQHTSVLVSDILQ
jgi:heat-inducible transcriptional repressor